MKCYKIVYLVPGMIKSEVFKETGVYTESGLKRYFNECIADGRLNMSTTMEYEITDATDATTWDINKVIEAFEYDGYIVDEIEVIG